MDELDLPQFRQQLECWLPAAEAQPEFYSQIPLAQPIDWLSGQIDLANRFASECNAPTELRVALLRLKQPCDDLLATIRQAIVLLDLLAGEVAAAKSPAVQNEQSMPHVSEAHAVVRDALHMTGVGAPPGAPHEYAVIYLGSGVVDTGPDRLTLDSREGYVLEALLDLGSTAKKDALVQRSGCDDAPTILKRIRTKHPSLAPLITLPGGKGLGGYRTKVRDGRTPK